MEVVERAVLHAEGAQRAPVNLRGEIAQQEPGRAPQGGIGVGAVAPAVGGGPAAGRLLLVVGGWGPGQAPQVLPHRGQVRLPAHRRHSPPVFHLNTGYRGTEMFSSLTERLNVL